MNTEDRIEVEDWNAALLEQMSEARSFADDVWAQIPKDRVDEMDDWTFNEKANRFVHGVYDRKTGCRLQVLIPPDHVGTQELTYNDVVSLALTLNDSIWDCYKLARAVWGNETSAANMRDWTYKEDLNAYVLGVIDDDTNCELQLLIPESHIGSYSSNGVKTTEP